MIASDGSAFQQAGRPARSRLSAVRSEARLGAFLVVVARQLRSQASRLHADDGVVPRVERFGLPENLDAHDEFLEALAASGEGLFDNEREETFQPIGLPESFTGKDPIELFAKRLRGTLC